MGADKTLRNAALAVLAVDVLVILAHVVTGGTELFNLDAEANVPTWYSSAKLLSIAFVAAAAWVVEEPTMPKRWMWLGVALLFTGMSMDETAQVHERTARWFVSGAGRQLRTSVLGGDSAKDSFAWVIIFLPAVVAVSFFLIAFAWSRRARLKRVLPMGAAGLGCYLAAFALEPAAVYFTPRMSEWDSAMKAKYDTFSMFEESFEIIGTTFLLLTALSYVLVTRRERAAAAAKP